MHVLRCVGPFGQRVPQVGFLGSQGPCRSRGNISHYPDSLFGDKKLGSDSRDSAQAGSRVDPKCVKEARLNASALPDPNSLCPSVTITNYVLQSSFPALVDSGSTHCFVDPTFVNNNAISSYSVPPIILRLFDSSTTTIITTATNLSICFPSGKVTPMTFYVTPLDSKCRIILGHNWLIRFNPLIDWVLGSIEFRTPLLQVLTPSSPPEAQFSIGFTSAPCGNPE